MDTDVRVTLEQMPGASSAEDSDFELKIEGDALKAPVEEGAEAGTLVIYEGDNPVAEFPVYAAESVKVSALGSFFSGLSLKTVLIILAVLAVIAAIAVYIFFALRVRRRARAETELRRAEREKRRREESSQPDDLAVKYRTERLKLQELRKPTGWKE